jgi:hypothetical protein
MKSLFENDGHEIQKRSLEIDHSTNSSTESIQVSSKVYTVSMNQSKPHLLTPKFLLIIVELTTEAPRKSKWTSITKMY